MAHVTFIHGIANKPKAEELIAIWRRALGQAGGDTLNLGSQGVSSTLIYWADVLYPAPDPNVAAHEGLFENTAAAVDGGGEAAPPVPVSPESAAFIEGLRSKLTDLPDEAIDPATTPEVLPGGKGLERIPLPWSIKKRIMAAHLRDVHHYLFNVEWRPRPADTYRVQDEIRRRFVEGLKASAGNRPHVVVSHSMGTVIAYDCLKRVDECPEVDGLITLGSPLGIDEIQDKLQPGWTRADGFPGGKVRGDWVNVYDCLDVVCGPDPRLDNDYRRGGGSAVEDLEVVNDGLWRHSATKYYRQPALRRALRRLVGL
jgi:hypothetical protein